MGFVRQRADSWAQNVPGVRWFKTDLHIHTIDDLEGTRAKMPSGLNGNPREQTTVEHYARRFLQSAVERGVQVLGVTPHSPRIDRSTEVSAVWQIVEEWNVGYDQDGIPFREKIFAVFPGFEPNVNDGRSGLHILFLFDPEIGRENFLTCFDLVMGGRTPWANKQLQMTNRDTQEAFDEISTFRKKILDRSNNDIPPWDCILLAPHIEDEKGLLGAQRAQVLDGFPHSLIAGLELGDERLPEDVLGRHPHLARRMAEHHQAFFHASDSYSVDDIGNRHMWMKLASPKIEALRQAILASDSRMRLGFRRDENGHMGPILDSPDITMNQRPWLKSVVVNGSASFFGLQGANKGTSRFNLSPDLTCVIGGSMTGKSTFLDGLRVHVHAPMPEDEGVREQVEARGEGKFLAGSPEISLECPGGDPTASAHERWPAVFFAQTELQRLAQDPGAVEEILARLVASETSDIKSRGQQLKRTDADLARAAVQVREHESRLAEAEQAFERSRGAAEELAAFSGAGVDGLNQVSSTLRGWEVTREGIKVLQSNLGDLIGVVSEIKFPELKEPEELALKDAGLGDTNQNLDSRLNRVLSLLNEAMGEAVVAARDAQSVSGFLEEHERELRVLVNRRLAETGVDGSRISELQALNAQASLMGSYQANFEESRAVLDNALRVFHDLLNERRQLISQQRSAYERVSETLRLQFEDRIVAKRIDGGNHGPLERFVRELGQRGITRWWNDLADNRKPTPDVLLRRLEDGELGAVGMSEAVQDTFTEQLSQSRRRDLAALRCPDRYVLELRMDDGGLRQLNQLSGGQRVNVLLSLLLETEDERPLVIDQPEDELDNRFLFETMLPALKRLKGRRQIIVATHNANIVVNGDADQVIHLEASSDRGRIANCGAIEEPSIRDAIVRTVDGGDRAFRERRLKYGF